MIIGCLKDLAELQNSSSNELEEAIEKAKAKLESSGNEYLRHIIASC